MYDLCPVAVALDSFEYECQPETADESLLLLLKQKKNCDVTFTFPNLNDRIEAHEVFLKARSPVFEKIFCMRKSGNVQGSEIEISESTPEVFQQFLEFIYADKFEVDIAGALELMQLSQKYKVHPLTEKCEELLVTQIPIMDSVKVFETARRVGRQELMNRAGLLMVKSFLKLVRSGSLANANEETLVYLLECDDLDAKEVGLFHFIVEWGRNQVGNSAEKGLLRNKLKNLISKIRYTNMAPDEFTTAVVPTGLLSAEETVLVYSYICGDEVTRRNCNIKFNTTRRAKKRREVANKLVGFYADQELYDGWFPAFSKQCISFKASQTKIEGPAWLKYFLKKKVISAIHLLSPYVNPQYTEHHVLKFNVLLMESCETLNGGNFTVRFQKELQIFKQCYEVSVSVEPPVELISGRTYNVIIEDRSTLDLKDSFCKEPMAYNGLSLPNMDREAYFDLEDEIVTFTKIDRKTSFYSKKSPHWCKKLAIILGCSVALV